MPVNLDASIHNADWTKRTNDLPPMKRRADLDAVIRDVSHWLRDLPSANPDVVMSVWPLLTEPERAIYNERSAHERKVGRPILRRDGSVVLSLRSGVSPSPIGGAVVAAFESAAERFGVDDDVATIERALVGLSDDLLDSLRDSYIPAVMDLVRAAEDEAEEALTVARRRSLIDPVGTPFRFLARRTPASAASARRYALSRALRLVDDLSMTARSAARDVLSRDDLQASTRVRRLRAVIGLNEPQHETFMRSMSELADARSRRFVLGSFGTVEVPADGLSSAHLQTLADRYAAHLLHQRATLIEQTESTTIREETRRALWEREESTAQFSWVSVGESCPQCASLDGVTVRAGEEYAGGVMTPPAHPGCDCTQAVRISA